MICARVEGWIERALELTIGSPGQAVIRESAHLAQDPALGTVLFCRYEAQWS